LNHIKPTLVNNGWECGRADEIYEAREIMNIIWEQIIRSDLIIAEITGRNVNVFYELGYAHALGKNTVLITQEIKDVPFDLRHRQLVEYSDTPEGRQKLSTSLTRYLQT
jgi:nucleoside 2-deoxyribosyltransferase